MLSSVLNHTRYWRIINFVLRIHALLANDNAVVASTANIMVNAVNTRFQGLMDHRRILLYFCWPWHIKWNESGFRPPLCTYRLNWARRTSWGWWNDWDDTVLQTQDTKFEPWRSEAVHATSRSRRLPTILTFTLGWWRNIFCFFQTAETGNQTLNSGVKSSGANHYPRAPALTITYTFTMRMETWMETQK